jgi:FkbM family methyltransferase
MNCSGGNVRIHAIALCDRDGDLTFELAPKASGDNRIRTGTESGDQLEERARPTITVPGRRLDGLLPRPIRQPLGIKIDTQGAEPLVVAGGAAVFAQADLVSMEFWPYGLFRLNGDVDGLIAFCRDHYREGSAVEEGDVEPAAPEWSPMSEIANILTRYTAHRGSPERYLNVLMRR